MNVCMARQRLDHLPLTTRRRPCGQRVAERRSGASVAICACGAVWRRLIWMEFCQLRCTASCCGGRRRADQHRQITGASPLPLPPPPPPRGPARGFALTYSSSRGRTSCHLPPGDLRTGQCTPHHWRTLDLGVATQFSMLLHVAHRACMPERYRLSLRPERTT